MEIVNKNNNNSRVVFFISDSTGITAEALGNSLLAQFEEVEFAKFHLNFIDTLSKAKACATKINAKSSEYDSPVLVFSTQINQKLRAVVAQSNCVFFDFFATFIAKMEDSLAVKSSHTAGRLHELSYDKNYSNRMSSINFVINSDDGVSEKSYAQADIILIGVSRSGKTPTCVFMALQYSLKATNYPLIEQDLKTNKLPKILQKYKHKIFGLTINPVRLHKIRDKRRGNSNYSSLQQCQSEVRRAEDIYHSNNIPFIDTTQISIEEITVKITNILSLR